MKYDDQYYILMAPEDDYYPNLVATESTTMRDYKFDPIPLFSAPVEFKNDDADRHPELKSKFLVPPLIKTSTSFISIETVKDYLEDFHELKGMRFHPAVYIASDEEVYKNYWFLNIYSKIDCWDRERSEFEAFLGDDLPPQIDKYVLSESVLDDIEEEDRLIFRMGWDSSNHLFVHQRIIDYFEEASVTGYRAFKVSEYEFGMEF